MSKTAHDGSSPRPTYANARADFLKAAAHAGFAIASERIGNDVGLYQDYAYKLLTDSETTLVHLSGVHGIEGYIGSKIQTEFLSSLNSIKKLNANCIFVHAVNPYGMSNYRRSNANNVDLNRNGIFTGSEVVVPKNLIFHHFLELMSSASRWQLLRRWPTALLRAIRVGFAQVSVQLPAGQYEFPELIFFGGHSLQQELRVLTSQLQKLAPQTKRWIFIDVHSGLGTYAQDLLLVADDSPASLAVWESAFAESELTIIPRQKKIYRGSGLIEDWIKFDLEKNGGRVFYMMQEFGTSTALKVLSQTILENAWFQQKIRAEDRVDVMLSAFFPDAEWAAQCTERALHVLNTTLSALQSN